MTKVIKICTVILLIIVALTTSVSAAYNWGNKINDMKTPDGNTDVNNSANNIIGSILNITRIVAVGVAVIMLMVLAMKYMMAAPGDRAEIKKSAVVYVVGAVVLFASSGILTIIMNLGKSIS